jgi:hypothetical protein
MGNYYPSKKTNLIFWLPQISKTNGVRNKSLTPKILEIKTGWF